MTLVATSIWVDQAFHPESKLIDLLQVEAVYSHAYVAGELAMGTFRNREDYLLLQHRRLPQAIVVSTVELLGFVRVHHLHGSGIGYIDAHLLASAKVMENTQLWTRDKCLMAAAKRLHLPTIAEYAH